MHGTISSQLWRSYYFKNNCLVQFWTDFSPPKENTWRQCKPNDCVFCSIVASDATTLGRCTAHEQHAKYVVSFRFRIALYSSTQTLLCILLTIKGINPWISFYKQCTLLQLWWMTIVSVKKKLIKYCKYYFAVPWRAPTWPHGSGWQEEDNKGNSALNPPTTTNRNNFWLDYIVCFLFARSHSWGQHNCSVTKPPILQPNQPSFFKINHHNKMLKK